MEGHVMNDTLGDASSINLIAHKYDWVKTVASVAAALILAGYYVAERVGQLASKDDVRKEIEEHSEHAHPAAASKGELERVAEDLDEHIQEQNRLNTNTLEVTTELRTLLRERRKGRKRKK